jgi:hypothetical protein
MCANVFPPVKYVLYVYQFYKSVNQSINSISLKMDNRSGRCGQCVRPIKHLPDLHIFYNFNWITHILAKSIKWFVYSFKWYLGTTSIIRVAGLRLLLSYYTIHPLSGYLDYDFCHHIILYTHYPGSWIMTSPVILYNIMSLYCHLMTEVIIQLPGSCLYSHMTGEVIRIMGVLYNMTGEVIIHTHYPGIWITTSAIILYFTPIIPVAGLWLLQSYYTIPPLSG